MQGEQLQDAPEPPTPDEAMQYPRSFLEENNLQLCQRPNYGTLGQRVMLLANYYRLHTEEGFYSYYVRFRQSTQTEFPKYPQNMACKLLNVLAAQKGWEEESFKFDGQNYLFTRDKELFGTVKNEPVEERIKVHDIEFIMEITYIGKAKFEDFKKYIQQRGRKFPAMALQALQVAINAKLIMNPNCQRIGASFFEQAMQEQIVDLGGDAELWFGFKQPVKICQKGVFLTLDTTATAFVKQMPLHHFIFHEILKRSPQNRPLSDQEKNYIQEKIQGLLVSTEYNGGSFPKRTHKIQGIGDSPLDFVIEDFGVNIVNYLEQTYGEPARIYYPRLQCIKVRKGNQIPMELCTIKGGQKRIRLDDDQKSQMTRASIQNPIERIPKIDQRANNISNYLHKNQHLPIEMDPQMFEVEGRVLQPPALKYKDDSVQPSTGEWRMNAEFKKPANVKSWAVVCFARQQDVDFDGFGIRDFLQVPQRKFPLIKFLLNPGISTIYSSAHLHDLHVLNCLPIYSSLNPSSLKQRF